MKTLLPALMLLAAPAWAHGGAHLHPHGGEWLLAGLIGLGGIAVGAALTAVVAIRVRK